MKDDRPRRPAAGDDEAPPAPADAPTVVAAEPVPVVIAAEPVPPQKATLAGAPPVAEAV